MARVLKADEPEDADYLPEFVVFLQQIDMEIGICRMNVRGAVTPTDKAFWRGKSEGLMHLRNRTQSLNSKIRGFGQRRK